MAYPNHQTVAAAIWQLASAQHGVVALFQLLERGYTISAVKHRVAVGRLHPVRPGVYAVGRPNLTREGEWAAAVLTYGPHAVLSHGSAAALWRIRKERERCVHVTTLPQTDRRHVGIMPHRRSTLTAGDRTTENAIPVTTPIRTLVDLAIRLPVSELEAAVNQADKLDLVDPDRLRADLDTRTGQQGVRPLRTLLDRRTFVLTDSELERRFLAIARRAGLGMPRTQARVNGFRVDFYWPDLGLVVETDGLRYHRTPAQQARDRVRDQAHAAAGLAHVRFTHFQVRYESHAVQRTVEAVARHARRPS